MSGLGAGDFSGRVYWVWRGRVFSTRLFIVAGVILNGCALLLLPSLARSLAAGGGREGSGDQSVGALVFTLLGQEALIFFLGLLAMFAATVLALENCRWSLALSLNDMAGSTKANRRLLMTASLAMFLALASFAEFVRGTYLLVVA